MSVRNLSLLLVFFMLLSCEVVSAQETEFLPEVDVYLKLNSSARLRGQASNTREGGDPTQLTIGPDLELYIKPLIRLKEVTSFDQKIPRKGLMALPSWSRGRLRSRPVV